MTTSTHNPADRHAMQQQRMLEAGQLRRRLFPRSSDEAWRRERLYRYLYWREHREHPPINLVGSWALPDLEREIARWNDYARRGLTEDEVLELLTADLAEHFGKPWPEALEEGTSALLASVNMPIWNENCGVLLPQALGALRIYHAEQYPTQETGWSYNYGLSATRQTLSITIYDAGFDDIQNGIDDPRVLEEFKKSWLVMQQRFAANTDEVLADSVQGPDAEVLTSSHGQQVLFGSLYVEVLEPDGTRRAEALSARGFRGNILKIRYTRTDINESDPEKHPGLDDVNRDLADFVGHFE
jgi:hypothetical protein